MRPAESRKGVEGGRGREGVGGEMQADVILKEPPSWVPPLSISGGPSVEGGRGGAAPLVRPWMGVHECKAR